MVSTRESSRGAIQAGTGPVGVQDSQTQFRVKVTRQPTPFEPVPPRHALSDGSEPEELGVGPATGTPDDFHNSSGAESSLGALRATRSRSRPGKLGARAGQSLVEPNPESKIKPGEITILKKKDTTKLETFLNNLDGRFVAAPDQYKTEGQRIRLGTSHVSENARRRWRAEVKGMTAEPHGRTLGPSCAFGLTSKWTGAVKQPFIC
ncbi:hypothetical protein BDW66DRAFT_155828 [Aspergillus desertorum]